MRSRSLSAPAGFSLVLTLIILTLLSVAIVGFLSGSTLDRATARAVANKTQAELAAQGGVNRAIAMLAQNITAYPDSATVWETVTPSGGGSDVEGTMLYYSNKAPNDATGVKYILPLISTGGDANGLPMPAQTLDNKAGAFGTTAWNDDTSIDINRPRFNGDVDGWVGAAPDARKPYRAKWVEVPGSTGANAKITSRYAFWIEDESFRLNLNTTGANPRAAEVKSPGISPEEFPYQGLLKSARAPSNVNPDSFALTTYNLRKDWTGKRLPELRSFNEGSTTYLLGDKTKFLSTIYSGGLNVSRHGTQRVNLNGLNFDQVDPKPEVVMKGLQQVMETVKFHAPKFGQRFYRNSSSIGQTILDKEEVTPDHQTIYLHKLAANIRDYIDPDFEPTMITNEGKLAPKAAPTNAFSAGDGPNEMWAQGKDATPLLQEAMVRFRGSIANNRFGLFVDYYIEFWNLTDKDIYAGRDLGNAFVRISDQVGWVGTDGLGNGATPLHSDSPNVDIGPSSGPDRDVVIDLTKGVRYTDKNGGPSADGVIFRAGTCTVITTDPDGLPVSPTGGVNASTTFYCPVFGKGVREYRGPMPTGRAGIKPQWRDTASDDYGTEVVLGNAHGYLESMPFALTGGGPAPVTLASRPSDTTHGGSLYGNSSTPSQLGDPRTNNEQLTITRFMTGSTGQPDVTRYFNQTGGFSLGSPNSSYFYPHKVNPWPDYYKGWDSTATTSPAHEPNPTVAPAFVLNGKLQSIGQLGDIFDPARVKGTVGSLGVTSSRGGGRTYKIGQPDDRVFPGLSNAVSRQWASYRLADFFSTSSEVQQAGLININGIRRDNGAALRAACYGMTLRATVQAPDAKSTLVNADKPLDTDETAARGVAKLILALKDRLEKNDPSKSGGDATKYFGPLMERGELGDLPLFATGQNQLLLGVKMDDAFDRTREEFARRMMDLITTRGSVYSVYAVGQSITVGPAPAFKRFVTATHQVKVTFQLVPVWKRAAGNETGVEAETWDPADPTARTDRFSKPDHYDVQILQVGS